MNLTATLRQRLQHDLPLDDLLPDELPAYVHSYVYLFGIANIAALVILILSGIVLAMAGPTWWHVSPVGHFLNSVHFWSVQAFFFFLVLHLWTTFFQGAWRDGRGATWVVGVLCFLVGIGTAFTGYISQQNFCARRRVHGPGAGRHPGRPDRNGPDLHRPDRSRLGGIDLGAAPRAGRPATGAGAPWRRGSAACGNGA